MPPSHRVAIVTGGAQGIGRAIAAALVRDGLDVMLADVNGEGALRTASELATGPARVAAQAIDLRQVEAIPGLVERTVRDLGRQVGGIQNLKKLVDLMAE